MKGFGIIPTFDIMKFSSFVFTHPGKIRESNEDNCCFDGKIFSDYKLSKGFLKFKNSENMFSACVCDGMGGEKYGDMASRIVSETYAEYFPLFSLNRVNEFVYSANKKVCDLMVEYCSRIGTTYAGLSLNDKKAYISNIGDTKIFLIRSFSAYQLSTDHTQRQAMINSGLFTEEKLKKMKVKNSLTQYIGINESEMIIEPHFLEVDIYSGDKFLICSDGLTDMLSIEKIVDIICNNELNRIANLLCSEALKNGGIDNITSVFVECFE